jgi:hypothetical protein
MPNTLKVASGKDEDIEDYDQAVERQKGKAQPVPKQEQRPLRP